MSGGVGAASVRQSPVPSLSIMVDVARARLRQAQDAYMVAWLGGSSRRELRALGEVVRDHHASVEVLTQALVGRADR